MCPLLVLLAKVCSSNAVVKVLQVLLRHGANTNVRNAAGESALVLELKRERQVSAKVVSLLLQYGARADHAALPRRLSSVLGRLVGPAAAARAQGSQSQGVLQASATRSDGAPQRPLAAAPPPPPPPRGKIMQAQATPGSPTRGAVAAARTPLAPTSAGALNVSLNTSAGRAASSAWRHGAVEIV